MLFRLLQNLARIATCYRKLLPTRRHRIAIAAILKNEAPYVLEWIAFHRAVGVQQFFIADNICDDGTSELLIALQEAGLIERLAFTTNHPDGPQRPAYTEIVKRFGNRADWIAFIDCDEFLTPTGNANSVNDVLSIGEADTTVGAICVNWAMYGSSGTLTPSNDPVVARFHRRATQSHDTNRHIKSIVRSRAFLRTALNSHAFNLRFAYRAIKTNGIGAHPDETYVGSTKEVVWDNIRLNHYFVKSKAEFELIKIPRGVGDGQVKRRGESQFQAHDYDDVSDPMPDWLIAATMKEMERIRELLRKSGCPEELVLLDKSIVERIEKLQREKQINGQI